MRTIAEYEIKDFSRIESVILYTVSTHREKYIMVKIILQF